MKKTHWIVILAVAATIAPGALAQGAMSDSHMSDSHMANHMGKMSNSAMDRHMYDDLNSEELRTAHHLFDRLSKSDRGFLKQEIHQRAMKAAKMESGSMPDNKMAAHKMGTDKMAADKMGGDKMGSPEARYNQIYSSLSDKEKLVVGKLTAKCEKWCKAHSGNM
jgi:hypothetical protein